MKNIGIVLITSIIMLSFTNTELNGYITLFDSADNAKYYAYGKSHYFEYFDNKKKTISEKKYHIKYRKYSWGDIDTTFIRKGKSNYYHIDKKTLKESIILPVAPKIGDKWLENDKSWSYEVIAEQQKFKTPKKKYTNCIKVHCKQLTNRDKQKNKEYYLFYSPEYGYIGNVDAKGKTLSYLSDIKLNAKEGDKLGGK